MSLVLNPRLQITAENFAKISEMNCLACQCYTYCPWLCPIPNNLPCNDHSVDEDTLLYNAASVPRAWVMDT